MRRLVQADFFLRLCSPFFIQVVVGERLAGAGTIHSGPDSFRPAFMLLGTTLVEA